MEQSPGRNLVQGMPGAAVQGSMPAEYWNSLDAMYSDPQHQSQVSQQQDPASQPTPMGIDWNHPIFQQQQQHQQHPQQQSQPAPQPAPNHGIYSSIPQSWQANPLQQPARGYPVPSQYQAQHQAPPFQQGQVSFEPRSLNPSESSAFPGYSFQPNYFQQPHLQAQDPFPGHSNRQNQQAATFTPAGPQSSMSQFSVRPGYSQELLPSNTIDLTNDFPEAQNGTSHYQTINPQFLNPAGQPVQPPTVQPNLLYGAPPEPQAADGRNFNYFENSFSARPQVTSGNTPGASTNSSAITGLPQPQVVIPVPKELVGKKVSLAKKTGPKAQKQTKARPGSDNSDDSELEIEAPDEASPLPLTRPKEPIAAAEYDTIQAVWSPRNKWPSADKIKGALVAFKDVIKAVRDTWRDQVQAMKAAENQGDNDKAAQLKEQVALQRRTLDRMVLATLNLGHPTIIEKLGEHPMTLSVCFSFLADRFQATDFEGSLTINLLKLLARFVTVDEELLQKTNLAKVLPKFVKKGGQVVKDLAQTIQDNASASTKRKQSNGKSGKEDSPSKGPASNSPAAEVTGSKRPREGENNAPPPTKRMVVTSNPKDASKPSTTTNGSAKPSSQNGKPATPAAPRPKQSIVAPKPTSLFGALSSASKRPGTTNAERAAAAAASKSAPPAEKKEKPAAPPPKPAFSFGDLMADLNKPKETEVSKPAEDKPPETEEERKKRLRKEERSKLRVRWKPDDSLTQVRLFTHDPDEELGPGDGSRKGIKDVKGEGSVLKLQKDLEDLEEDDLGGLRETNLHDYVGLSEIIIESEEQKSANYIKRGGNQQPDSPEKAAQEHRESTTLMVFYTSPADVPASPKEPPASDSEETVPDAVPFGELPDHIKARSDRYFAYANSTPSASAAMATAGAAPQSSNTSGGNFDISNLLKIIQTGQPQQQATPPPQPAQAPMSDLERTINMFRQQSQAPVPQPAQMPAAQPAPPAAGGGSIDFSQILNMMKQLQNPALSQPQQAQPNMAPNLGAMFSQVAGQNQQSGLQQGYDANEDPERKRTREDRPPEEQFVRSKRTKANGPKPYKYQVVPCRFWAEGRCIKGDNCTYRHDTT